jgi:2-polyprenyl-3-methyl-5-hydroxy-6-metoxy-1,4-benzoquinol methylase
MNKVDWKKSFFLYSLLFFQVSVSYADSSCNQLLKRIFTNDFNTFRTLSEYNQYFGGKLRPRLRESSGKKKVWIDMGAGSVSAQVAYLNKSENPMTCIAVAFKVPVRIPTEKFKTLRIVEGLQTPETISDLPKADLITDVMGILTYAEDQRAILRSYIHRLKPGGSLMIYTYGADKNWIKQEAVATGLVTLDRGDHGEGLIFTKK